METINYRDVGFEFEKIGRALTEDYYYYNQAILVCDSHQYVFQKTSTKDWFSLGEHGYRVFKEHLNAGKFKLIDFSEPEVIYIEYAKSFVPPNKMYIYFSNDQKATVLDDGSKLATAIHGIMCYDDNCKTVTDDKLKAIGLLVKELPRTKTELFEIEAIKRIKGTK